jgi:DNA-binding response OmpR family regulator
MTILVVDANIIFGKELAKVLRHKGYTVDTAPDLFVMRRRMRKEQYDCVILDLLASPDSNALICEIDPLRMKKILFTVSKQLNKNKAVVLIVEDEISVAKTYKASFEHFKINNSILVAHDGEEALSILASIYDNISFILLDLLLPKIDGLSFLAKLKTDPRFASIPVIAMSGDHTLEHTAINVGKADGFISKPFNCTELVEKLIHLNLIQRSNGIDYMQKPRYLDDFNKLADQIDLCLKGVPTNGLS